MNHPMIKLLVALGFVGILLAYLLWPRRLPPPREENRVSVPGYFSIIAPPDWEPAVSIGDKIFDRELLLRPREHARREPTIRVRRFRDRPAIESFLESKSHVQATVANQPVYVQQRSTRMEYLWIFVLERDGKWFEITLSTPIAIDFGTSDWKDYVESFRADPIEDALRTRTPATTQSDGTSLP